MKELDNRNLIKKLLKFSDDTFYFLQIIRRKKENPDMNRPEEVIFQCTITSENSLSNYDKQIEILCREFNARAYISLLSRSIKKFLYKVQISAADRIFTDNYRGALRIWNSCALSEDVVRWKGILDKSRTLLDIDNIESLPIEKIEEVFSKANVSIELLLPTKNGWHIICENHYPGNYAKHCSGDDWEIPGLFKFTKIDTCNTIYYAAWKE